MAGDRAPRSRGRGPSLDAFRSRLPSWLRLVHTRDLDPPRLLLSPVSTPRSARVAIGIALLLLALAAASGAKGGASGAFAGRVCLQGALAAAAWALAAARVGEVPAARLGLLAGRWGPVRGPIVISACVLVIAGANAWLSVASASFPVPAVEPPWLAASLSFLAVVPLTAVCEEIFFRGALQRALEERVGPAAAILGSALAFTLFHLETGAMLLSFGSGLLLGTVASVSRSVRETIWVHGLHNGWVWAEVWLSRS